MILLIAMVGLRGHRAMTALQMQSIANARFLEVSEDTAKIVLKVRFDRSS